MNYSINPDLAISANAERNAAVAGGIGLSTHYIVEARDPQGHLKWVDEFDNLVVTAGLNVSLTQTFLSASAAPDWHVGLTAGTPTFDPTDTMASHAGWTEVVAYDELVRQPLTLGSVSNGSVSNTASKAVFTIATNSTTIGGAFVTTASAKATDTGYNAGVLYGGGAFVAGNKVIDDGDTLSVTCTLTATAA
jgi:hypothetical protein